MKICLMCGKPFPPAKFQTTQQKFCSPECRDNYKKKLYHDPENHEKILANKRVHYENNKDMYAERNKRNRELHRDKINKQKMEHYYQNPEPTRRKNKENYEKKRQDRDFMLKQRWLNQEHDKRGITFEDFKNFYYKTWDAQGGKCAICGVIFKDDTATRVDHDHRTDKLRGLLCNNCNAGIGYFDDETDVMLEAINYIKTRKNKL